MKRTILRILAIGIIGLPVAAIADPIQVTYDVGTYSTGGYSASWVHGATGCSGSSGPDTELTLYMCGDPLYETTGTIAGMLDGGVLTITGGILNIGGTDYDVEGGELGGVTWTLTIESFGTFLFEGFDWGDAKPNNFDGSEFILWGQNEAAYRCIPGDADCSEIWGDRWGIDLYGTVRVPEPGTLALFGIGLLGLGLARRRKA